MDNAIIKAIIEEQGYSAYFRNFVRHSALAKGNVRTTVYAREGRASRCLGNFEAVTQLSEEGLRALIAEKFALPPARIGRVKQ